MWMRRMLVTAATLGGATMAMAQGAAPAIPEYTNDQRWGRLAFLNLSAFATEVALGKSRGVTVDEIGKWLGDHYAATWAGGLDARQFAIALRLNSMSHPASRVELPTFTDSLLHAWCRTGHRDLPRDVLERAGRRRLSRNHRIAPVARSERSLAHPRRGR